MGGQRNSPVLVGSLLCKVQGFVSVRGSPCRSLATSPSFPCRSLQCRDLLPAPRLGRFCRNSLSCNDCLPEIGLASRCFLANFPANSHFAGRGQGSTFALYQQNVGLRTCRLGLQPLGRPGAGRARISSPITLETSLSPAQLEVRFGHSACIEQRVQEDRGDR
jgi:hypothetical protein